MAATALFGGGGGGLTRAPVLAGSARQRRATGGGDALPIRALLGGTGLQTLGLIQVTAAHLGIAGQEL